MNYYGYTRNTEDLDIWLAPTVENRKAFIDTLLCMNYSESEVTPLLKEDFTTPFVGSIGSAEAVIDVLTFVHQSISFVDAEKQKVVYEIQPQVFLSIVPYEVLKDMKLRTHREKDLFDVARMEEFRNSQKPGQ